MVGWRCRADAPPHEHTFQTSEQAHTDPMLQRSPHQMAKLTLHRKQEGSGQQVNDQHEGGRADGVTPELQRRHLFCGTADLPAACRFVHRCHEALRPRASPEVSQPQAHMEQPTHSLLVS